ncbi:hypothetical protein CHELA1G11_10343 [Hyphomicrobiales bacterium]|nr:hypothetical protein CHELA1G11_10343 [Hyphomicrobiales bacterium]
MRNAPPGNRASGLAQEPHSSPHRKSDSNLFRGRVEGLAVPGDAARMSCLRASGPLIQPGLFRNPAVACPLGEWLTSACGFRLAGVIE